MTYYCDPFGTPSGNLNQVVGKLNGGGIFELATVTLDGELLNLWPSNQVHNHSPAGFGWGYSGSGPTQLALAIMLKFVDADQVHPLYCEFRKAFIQDLDTNHDFDIKVDIEAWIRRQTQ